jgi:transitional endoplasmic reticulum ATPase
MHTLAHRKPAIPTLYVRSAPGTGYIAAVFSFARRMAPCMLVLEDIETIVTPMTRSYFFNEVDGLDNNDGILMLASTNFLDRLDPGLSKRPSRFDRKYLFPLPNKHERELYAQYWRHKLEGKPKVDFPEVLCPAIAKVTYDFSFAYIQEAFVATLLEIARRDTDNAEVSKEKDGDNLNQYLLWRIFKEETAILRKDMGSRQALVTEAYPRVQYNAELSISDLEQSMRTASLHKSVLASPGPAHGHEHNWTLQSSSPNYDQDFSRGQFPRISEHRCHCGNCSQDALIDIPAIQ